MTPNHPYGHIVSEIGASRWIVASAQPMVYPEWVDVSVMRLVATKEKPEPLSLVGINVGSWMM